MNKIRTAHCAIGLLAAGIAFLLVRFIAAREPWLDEFHTVLLSGMPWSQLFDYITGDVHPPLYFILTKLWAQILDSSAVTLRYLSAATHLAAAGVFYALLRKRYPDSFAWLVGVALLLTSPALFYYASEARSYSLSVLWATLALMFILRFRELQNTPKWRHAIWLGVFLSIGFYIHYTNAFVAAGIVIALLILNRSLKQAVVVSAAFLAACAPWMPVTLAQMKTKGVLDAAKHAASTDPSSLGFMPGVEPGNFTLGEMCIRLVENVASTIGMLPTNSLILMAFLAIPIIVACGLAAAATFNSTHRDAPVLAASVAITMLLGLLALGISDRRYLLAIAPFLIFALVGGLEWLRTTGRIKAALVASAAIFAVYLAGSIRVTQAPEEKNLANLVRFLDSHSKPDDVVIFSALYSEIPFQFTAKGPSAQLERAGFPMRVEDWWNEQPFKGWGGPTISRAELDRYVTSLKHDLTSRRAWLVQFEPVWYDPHEQLLAGLKAQGVQVTTITGEGFDDSHYQLFLVTLP